MCNLIKLHYCTVKKTKQQQPNPKDSNQAQTTAKKRKIIIHKMDRIDLVVSLVFDNDETFKNLTKMDLMKTVLTSKQYKSNKNIMRQIDINYIKYNVYKLFEIFDENIKNMGLSKDRRNIENYTIYMNNIDIISNIIQKECIEFQHCFIDLVIAEYKEYVYENFYGKNFDGIQCIYMKTYKEFLISNDLLYDHVHDPNHYMYQDTNRLYMFYEKIEKFDDYKIKEENYYRYVYDSYDDYDE